MGYIMTNKLQGFWFSETCEHFLIGRLSLIKTKILLLGLFLIGGLCFESKAEPQPLVFIDWTNINPSAGGKESKALRQISEKFLAIDLEASGFPEVQNYLSELNRLLTDASTSQDGKTARYYVFLTAPLDGSENAFIYKYQPRAAQYYNGYVYITLPLLVRWVERSLNKKMNDLSEGDFHQFLLALQGVSAHEFAHPIEDAQVKWSWRESQGQSREDHSPADEVATDALAVELLREAHLDPAGLFQSLKSIRRPQGYMEIALPLFGTHPQDQLRINLMNLNLLNGRISRGTPSIQPIPYDFKKLKGEWVRLFDVADGYAFLKSKIEALPEDQRLLASLKALRGYIERVKEVEGNDVEFIRNETFRPLIQHYRLIAEFGENRTEFTDKEMAQFAELFTSHILKKNRAFLTGNLYTHWLNLASNASYVERGGIAGPLWVRRLQRELEKIPLFSTESFKGLIEEKTRASVIEFILSESDLPATARTSFDSISHFLPKDLCGDLFHRGLEEIKTLQKLEQVPYLLRLWVGVLDLNLSPAFETLVIEQLLALIDSDKPARLAFENQFPNIEFHNSFKLGEEREGYARRFLHDRFNRHLEKEEPIKDLINARAKILKFFFEKPPQRDFYQGHGDNRMYFALQRLGSETLWHYLALSLYYDNNPIEVKNAENSDRYPNSISKVHSQTLADLRFNWLIEKLKSDAWQDWLTSEREHANRNRESDSTAGSRTETHSLGLLFPLSRLDWARSQKREIVKTFLQIDKLSMTDLPFIIAFLTNPDQTSDSDYTFHIDIAVAVLDKLITTEQNLSYPQLIAQLNLVGFTENAKKRKEKMPEDAYLRLLDHLFKTRKLSRNDYGRLAQPIWDSKTDINHLLNALSQPSGYFVRAYFQSLDKKGSAFVREILNQFDLSKSLPANNGYSNAESNRNAINAAKELGLKYHQHYLRFLSQIAEGLRADFLSEHGLNLKEINEDSYGADFKARFAEIAAFFELIFNPDKKLIPSSKKHFFNYFEMENLTTVFSKVIPNGLEREQYWALWMLLSAKRPSDATDEIFEKYLLNASPALTEKEIETILEHGLIRSEAIKINLLRRTLWPTILAAASDQQITNEKLDSIIIRQVLRLAPGRSRFRDVFLDDISWELFLTEQQCEVFIEPYKTYEFKAIDPDTIRFLGVAHAAVSRISKQEKFRLLEYIQDPRGELFELLPSLRKDIEQFRRLLQHFLNLNYFEVKDKEKALLQELQHYIRDGGETERFILNSIVIASLETGLWHLGQKEQAREATNVETFKKLYALTRLSDGVLTFVKAYLRALPEHEQPLVLSYLVALATERNIDPNSSKILKFFELHQSLGQRAAQLASILNIFGDDESKKLSAAKSLVSPPTRINVFRRLKKLYSQQVYNGLKLKRLLGAGGIKIVVQVLFPGSKSTTAVYLRRSHLDETTDANFVIISRFLNNLIQDGTIKPGEYDYYLTLLREQAKKDGDLLRELRLSKLMGEKYAKAPPHKGWSFEAVMPESGHAQTEEALHFEDASHSTIKFEGLNEDDKAIVSELIARTEFDFNVPVYRWNNFLKLFYDLIRGRTASDFDRHLGNFLFDPKKKKIRPIDFTQVEPLTPNGIVSPGDYYWLAKIFYGLTDSDKKRGATTLVESFLAISAPPNLSASSIRRSLLSEIETILTQNDVEIIHKLKDVVAALHGDGVQLPAKITLNLLKGLLILSNEKYASFLAPNFISDRIAQFTKQQLVLGMRFSASQMVRKGCAPILALFSPKPNPRE
jgi:hypothetical protein